MKWVVTIVVLALSSGCGACSVVPVPQAHNVPSVDPQTTYQVQVREGTFDKNRPPQVVAPYADDFRWYLLVNYDVWEDDPQSDQQILEQVLSGLRLEHRQKIQEPIGRKKGIVEVVGLTIYRAKRTKGRVGDYTSGIIVSVEDLFDLQKRVDQIVENSNIHKRPVTSAGDAMMDEYHSGQFERSKS